MKTVGKILLATIAAWLAGLVVIVLVLYLGNGGADFTLIDVSGFATIFVVFFTLLVLGLYLPVFAWRRRRNAGPFLFPLLSGLLLNIPVYVLLAILIGRKVSPMEGAGFMLTFLVAGAVFGCAFVLTGCHRPTSIG